MNADAILKKIDSGELSLSATLVTRRLCAFIDYSEPSDLEILAAFDRGDTMDPKTGHPPLSDRIVALPMNEQGALRLLWGLFIPDEPLDRYVAEFLIHWAREQGVSEVDILGAFEPI